MLSLPNPILSSAIARPEHIVLRDGAVELTALALRKAVSARAAWLAEQGIKAHDTVALWGPAGSDFIINLHALGWLGAAVAPLAVEAPAAERQRHLQRVQACTVVVGPNADAATRDSLRAAAGAQGRLLPTPALTPAVSADAVPERFWPADEVRLVVLSSGSTGVPQPVQLTTTQLFFSAAGSASRLGHHVDDTWLLCLPLHHVGGLSIVFRAAFFGAAIEMMPRFDPVKVAHALQSGRISLVSLVPQMLSRVLDAASDGDSPFRPSPKLRAILLGGAPASPSLLARCAALGLPVCVTWGMSESASQVATTWPGQFSGSGDCGPALPFARVTTEAPEGPLVVRGPVVGQGALTTNDWGSVTAAGRVRVQGRCDDILISGGENIAPFEVESVLLEHPAVADAAVVGVPDATWGQRPWAALVAAPGGQPNDTELVAWCRGRLASFKIPAQFVWCESLPRDALGKLRRMQVLLDVHQGVEHA